MLVNALVCPYLLYYVTFYVIITQMWAGMAKVGWVYAIKEL